MGKIISKAVNISVAAPSSLPVWVPPPGEVRLLTQSNKLISNRFIDQCASFYEPFYFVKTVNDFSGAFKNPYWGKWGCTVFFGGGHAGTNDNTVTIAQYDDTAISFKRVSSPTPWFGGVEGVDPGPSIRQNNSNGTINTEPPLNSMYGEATIDGQQCSPHSYGMGDIIGPEHGGGAYGSLITIATGTLGRANETIAVNGAIAAHQMRFDTMTLKSSDGSFRKWKRFSDSKTPADWGRGSCPWHSCFVPTQKRIYFQGQNDGNPGRVRWFDLTSKTYVVGTGSTFSMDSMDGFDSGILFHVPSRDIMLAMYPMGQQLKVEWMNVGSAVTQPTANGFAKLSQPLAVSDPWSAACWCIHNNRIIVAGVTGDNSAVYEIEIPSVLTDAWRVTRAPFASGQTFAPGDHSLANPIGITYKKFQYDEKIKSIVYMPFASATGEDQIWVYRPRGT